MAGKADRLTVAKQSTVGLHRLRDDNKPEAIASGCVVKYSDRRYVLTVAHAVQTGRWGLKVKVTPDRLQEYSVRQYTLLAKGSINIDAINNGSFDAWDLIKDPTEIDFAFAELPPDCHPKDEIIDKQGVKYSRPINEIESDLSPTPGADRTYFFFGETKAALDDANRAIITTPQFVDDMRYLFDTGDFHVFELPFVVTDPAFLQGCSGAPILDENGILYSLVVGSYRNTNRLLGIQLGKYKIAVDIENGLYG